MKRNLSALVVSQFFLLVLFFILAPKASSFSCTEEEEQQRKIHHEIVVTATRLETPIQEAASAITLLKKEELPLTSTLFPNLLFRQAPGVFFLQAGSAGGPGSVFIRGAGSDHTLFMIDGLEINDPISPARSFNFNLFSLGLVERVEILRGPQSTLYGSDALAGVINLITSEPEKNEAVASGFIGTSRTRMGNFYLAQIYGKFSLVFDFNSSATAGISAASSLYPGNSEPDGFEQHSLAFKVSYKPSSSFSLSWQTRALSSRTDLDTFGGPYGDDPNSVQKSRFYFNRLELKGRFWNQRWEQKLAFGLQSSRRDNDNSPDDYHPGESEQAFYRSRLIKVDWQNNLLLAANNTLVFGVDFRREQGSSSYAYFSPWGDYQSNFPLKESGLLGFYLQDQWKPWPGFTVNAGLRFDHHQKFGQAFTFRTAVNLELPEIQARIKATTGSGFKAPSLYQLYAPEDIFGPIGNLSLLPERNLGWDFGVEKSFGQHLTLSLTWFETRYRNLIQFYFGAGYKNLGRALTRGLESFLVANFLENFALQASWTHLQAEDLETRTALIRRPKDSLSVSLNFKYRAFRLEAWLNYLGSRQDLNYSIFPPERVTLKAATITNLLLNFELNKRASLFIEIQNLFNTRYELIYGYGTPGATISSGFRLKL